MQTIFSHIWCVFLKNVKEIILFYDTIFKMDIDSIFEELQKYITSDPDNWETWTDMAKEKIKKYVLQKNNKIFEELSFQLTPKNLLGINNGD